MPDRIPELDRLAAAAQEVPMLTANEVRRRGDRRRTIRRSGLAGLSVLAVTALGVGVWASPLMNDIRNPQWATTVSGSPSPAPSDSQEPSPEPTPSPSVAPTRAPEAPEPPTWANVATIDLMFPYDPSVVDLLAEYEGMGQAPKGLCDPGEWGDASTILVREYGITRDFPTTAIVLGYPDVESASAGYDLIAEAARDCEAQMRADGWDRTSASADDLLPFDGSAVEEEPARAEYFFGMAAKEGQDVGVFNDTLVMQAGTRVAWLVTTFEGMDNNCSVLPNDDAIQCAFAKSMPDVLNLLVK